MRSAPMSTCEESLLPATTHSKRQELESGYASRMRAIARDEGMWPEGLPHLLIQAPLIEEIA